MSRVAGSAVAGSGGGGAVDSVFGRTGVVDAEAGDYTVAQVTGAAPLASPTFSGVVDADGAASVLVPTVAVPSSTTDAASTAFASAVAAAAALPAYSTTAALGPTVSGTGLQPYINVTTPALAAGTYSITWSVISTHTALGSTQGVQCTAGATQVPTAVIDGCAAPSNGSKTTVNSRGAYVHAGGTLALLVAVRRSSGTGNIVVQSGSIELRRIA